jgi:PKD repeat protein
MVELATTNLRRLSLFLIACAVMLVVFAYAGPANETGAGYIIVTDPPVADFFTGVRYGSAPFTVTFSDSSRGREPLVYFWEFGDGATSEMKNPTHIYPRNGEYTVSLTVTNAYGSDTKSLPAYIGVGDPLDPAFTPSAPGGPAPFTVSFVTTPQTLPANWSWDFGDGTVSFEENPVHTYTVPGNYTVTVKLSNDFGVETGSGSQAIVVSTPVPTPVLTTTAPILPAEEGSRGISDLIRLAKGTTVKDLPAGGLIPPQFMALAAMLTSLAVLLVQWLIVHAGVIWQFFLKFLKFFAELFGEHAAEKLNEKEIAARKLAVRRLEPHFLGLSSTEILVIEAAVLMVALAFIFADRAELTLMTVLIYLGVGAVSVVLHDFAHRVVMTRHGCDADTRFWGLGTAIMFLTAWLFGNVFAQSYRNLASREGEAEPRALAMEMVAGPLVSIVLMAASLALVGLGGLWAVAGGVGFTVNLMTALYSLMPIDTMDGLPIWRWNRAVYLGLLLPVLVFYLYTYIVVA